MASAVAVGWFDGAEVELEEPETARDAAALKNFLRLTALDRFKASRHVYAYYRDFHSAVGGQDWLDSEMGIPTTPEDIWKHVRPMTLFAESDPDLPGHSYVVIEANCDWEVEHGLMLVWEDGKRLTKVSGYDGNFSNAWAGDDDALKNVVYAASDPQFQTLLDP